MREGTLLQYTSNIRDIEEKLRQTTPDRNTKKNRTKKATSHGGGDATCGHLKNVSTVWDPKRLG